jgi:transcription elongation factor B subunit 1
MDEEKEPPAYTTLISSDGYRFVITRSAAMKAGMIKRMLNPRCLFSCFPFPSHLN